MRKKLMSCLVAFAFVLSIAAPSAFAAPSSNAGLSASSTEMSSTVLNESEGDGSFVQTPGKPSDEYVDGIVGRITQVFNYKAGQLITVMDANFNITAFDNGRVRATFIYNFENGTYGLGSMNFYGSDIEKINAAGGLKNFLLSLGVTESQLQYDANQNKTAENADSKWEDVKWLNTAFETLKQGVNHSISINFAAPGGATLTVLENGKPQFGYAADGTLNAKYIYKNGFLTEVHSLAYEISKYPKQGYEELEKTGVIDKNKTYTEEEKQSLQNQSNGEIEFKPTWNITKFNAYGQEAYTTTANGFVISKNEYSINGSLNKRVDLTTNETTYYTNNKPSHVTNSNGHMTTQFFYHANGTMEGAVTYNNGVPTQMTAYIMGKAIGTVDLSQGPMTFAAMRTSYKDITTPGKTVDEINHLVAAGRWTNISLYAGHMLNSNLLAALGFSTDLEMKKMMDQIKTLIGKDDIPSELTEHLKTWAGAKDKNAKDAAWNALVDYLLSNNFGGELGTVLSNLKNKLKAEDIKTHLENAVKLQELKAKKEKGVKLSDEEKKQLDELSASQVSDETVALNIGTLSTILNKLKGLTPESRAKQVKDLQRARDLMMKHNNGSGAVASVSIANNNVEKATGDTKVEYYDKDGNLKGDQKWADSNGVVAGDSKNIDIEKRETTPTVTENILSYSITVMSMGAAAFAIEGAKHTLSKTAGEKVNKSTASYDPAVIGVVNAFVDANGNVIEDVAKYMQDNPGAKVYAKVGAEAINMLDGGTFQAANGEEIFIEIDAEMAKQLSVGDKGMFMGDVIQSSNGKFEMIINKNYTLDVDGQSFNGFVPSSSIEAAKKVFEDEAAKAVNGQSKYDWMNKNVSKNRVIFGLQGNSYLNDWKAGWAILAGWNN